MRTYALALLLLVAAPVGAAQAYRWVDEHGVTTYGEKPPAGRQAHPVNVELAGTLESRTLPPARVLEAPAAPAAAAPAQRNRRTD